MRDLFVAAERTYHLVNKPFRDELHETCAKDAVNGWTRWKAYVLYDVRTIDECGI